MNGAMYSRMDQVKFKNCDMVCQSRPYHVKFLKGCFPQILPGLFLNT